MIYIQIQWTCASEEEARKIGQKLLQKKWVACINILPKVQSLYLWNGEVQQEDEVKVFLNEGVYKVIPPIL